MRKIHSVLVVDDETVVRAALRRTIEAWGLEVVVAGSVAEAQQVLSRHAVDLVLTDVRLPDGTGVAVAKLALHARPAPLVIAMSGAASREEAFELGQHGVAVYVDKPVDAEQLRRAFDDARRHVPDLGVLVPAAVGHMSVRRTIQTVRDNMLAQAVSLSEGNATHAGRILRITRQAVKRYQKNKND
ncbi:MAG: response regulator [Myxococcota bacterium]